jgi:hypothetical protein
MIEYIKRLRAAEAMTPEDVMRLADDYDDLRAQLATATADTWRAAAKMAMRCHPRQFLDYCEAQAREAEAQTHPVTLHDEFGDTGIMQEEKS